MFESLRKTYREWKGLEAFKKLPKAQRQLVFYSEGRGYWTYFEAIFKALQDEHAHPIVYVTSAENDPLLLNPPEGMQAFYVGEGSMRTLFFSTLDVRVLLMTMPDLQSFHIKRSLHPVHYVYLHHSIVSTHMVYRQAAFDHFDSILCVGPHHVQETRVREQLAGLRAKVLIEHGYGRLDAILVEGNTGPLTRSVGVSAQVLVAPSWGESGLLEQHGLDVIRPLVDAGLRVILRPHSRTRKLRPEILDAICEHYRDEPLFRLDEDGDGRASLIESDLMVSDWSGAALEFSLGLERPTLFVDVARKILSPGYEAIGLDPLEARIRTQIGTIVAPQDLASLGSIAADLIGDAHQWQSSIRTAREHWVFNSGTSGSVAAAHLVSLLD
ncbi:CDP-glycerol glycerophosphotransferase family protein [Pseudomonas sp. YeP6b]|uniref:CDP-glycerol glycerophosphotransferase family protein n=1 Tax=Pseudomonas sp. YeP6b TaxID=2861775 RepID=UPI0021D8A89B|nr:CDP-glycerol glycerophosphotransferase family protein [Pseudomonas sp. YeP6b]UXZ21261.1 CDP-glycerol glycerophosphotransferase family protein [Pseudomonas sp. YeP6b]